MLSRPFWQKKYLRPFLVALSGSLLFLGFDGVFSAYPSLAAEELAVKYGFFVQAIPVADLRTYAEKHKASEILDTFLGFLDAEQQKSVEEFLQIKVPLEQVALEQALNTEVGKKILADVSQTIENTDNQGVKALKSAIILGAKYPGGLSIISFLEAYPSPKITINALEAYSLAEQFKQSKPGDNVASTDWWQMALQYQLKATAGKQYNACLFGDSISSGMGNSLGNDNFNFAIGGMSTVSLLQQLRLLSQNNLQCQKAIVAIGTNDAMYGISDDDFNKNMTDVITLLRLMGTQEIVLIPAFYSTLAASYNPKMAGTITRVDEINTLINKVAATENIPVAAAAIQPLFKDHALNAALTGDGVHLNAKGIEIYKQALLKIINSPPVATPPTMPFTPSPHSPRMGGWEDGEMGK